MGKCMILPLLICMVMFSGIAMAAELHGTIYDISLNELSDVIVEVDSEPQQRYVSKDGMYRFSLGPGDYSITATYQTDRYQDLSTTEKISIVEDGDYVFDLFLFPEIDDEEDYILTGTDLIDLDDSEVNGRTDYTWLYLIIIAVLIILIIAYFFFRRRRDQEIEEELRETKKVMRQTKKMLSARAKPESKKAHEPVHDDIQDSDLKMVIDILKKEGGRTTQKELRKQIPLSEAKISLMISELQHKKIVQKVKKGRGNILILRQD